LQAKLFPFKNPINFEEWVVNNFGRRLFTIFFKTYTEKVWGVPCTDISADWAVQRIKGLSLSKAIWHAFFGGANAAANGKVIKTLIDSFRYPKLGPGMMWEACAAKSKEMGVKVEMGQEVIGLQFESTKWSLTTRQGAIYKDFDYVISSAPLAALIPSIQPTLPLSVKQAAQSLRYRDFLTVVLICNDEDAFHDNWVYIHDPSVKVGRIQNFKFWSPYMVPDDSTSCYGLEYFCFEGDGLWTSSNEDLIELAKKEIAKIGLAQPSSVLDGYVVRQPKAYPVYDQDYKEHVEKIRQGIKGLSGLYLTGRNGMHKYNNQDHSMMTAMLAAKNIIAEEELYDLWAVNEDAEYHESGGRGSEKLVGGRAIPLPVKKQAN